MTETEGYDFILDGSNIIYENKQWGDGKTEVEDEEFDAINVDRLKLAVEYFEEKEYKVLVCMDFSTSKKVSKYFKPSKRQLTKFLKDNNAIKIQGDSELVKLKRENPNSMIVTNDGFSDWISGDEVAPEITSNDWEKEKKERQEFGFIEGIFTTARKSNRFTKGEELPNKPKAEKKVELKETESSNYLDRIRSRLQSLDDRTQNQTTKINNINSLVQELGSLVQDIVKFNPQSNSSTLIPCKFEDEFGQSHLCLLGDNLHIWGEGKWIEIPIGENARVLE